MKPPFQGLGLLVSQSGVLLFPFLVQKWEREALLPESKDSGKMAEKNAKVLKDTRKYEKYEQRPPSNPFQVLCEQLDKPTTYGKLSPSLLLRIVAKLNNKPFPDKCWFTKHDKLKVSYTNGQRGMVSIKLLLYEALHGPLGPDSRRYLTSGKIVTHRTRQGTDAVRPKGCRCVNPRHMDYV